jgi:hypothetical protein
MILGVALALCASAARAALTSAQLTSAEKQTYAGLKNDGAAAQSFLITREYLRECRKVVEGSLSPGQLPFEPDGFDPNYVSPAEQKIVDKAINMNIAAMLSRGRTA